MSTFDPQVDPPSKPFQAEIVSLPVYVFNVLSSAQFQVIMPSLFEDVDSGSSDETAPNSTLKVNSKFAKHYEAYREKEEYAKLKAKFADDEIDDSSSSEEEVGPDAINDEDFLKVLSAIRRKDPMLYDKNTTFFSSQSSGLQPKNKDNKKKRPLLIDEYQRNVMLSQTGDEEDEKDVLSRDANNYETFLCYNEEQKKLKEELTKMTWDDSLDQDDNLLIPKQPSSLSGQNPNEEGEDFQNWFDENQTMFTEKEKCLLQYIVDQGRSDQKSQGAPDEYGDAYEDEDECESDTDFVQRQEDYERVYNFRFETPGGCDIKSFPRQVTETLRQPDSSSRSEKRKESREKQKLEEDKLREEMKRLKQLKKKELMSRLDKIKSTAGKDVDLFNEDLESDFDPDKHDALMEQHFNEQYYEMEDEDLEDNEKPEFTDSEDELLTEESSRNDVDELLKKPAGNVPVFDPSIETFEKYLEKNYNLDLDAMVEEEVAKKTDTIKPKYKFKYRETISDSFGLTVEEILAAPDRELNSWVSLKKASQYRDQKDEFHDKRKFERRANDRKKKAHIFSSLYKSADEVPNFKEASHRSLLLSDIKFCAEKKRRKQKKQKKSTVPSIPASDEMTRKTKIRGPAISGLQMSDHRLKAYGIKNPTKFRHVLHTKNKQISKQN